MRRATTGGDAVPGLRGVSERIRSSEVTPVELVAAAERRFDAVEHEIRAFSYVDWGRAHRAAEIATALQMRGQWTGPLHGIPFACKDTIDVAGMPTTYGTVGSRQRMTDRDAPIVKALCDLGAICIGKLATSEFAGGDYLLSAAPRNPHDLERTPGGSSGGAAAAVAAGIVPFAVAADTGGSARIPAAYCGVTALRHPSTDFPLHGVAPLSPSLDAVALIASGVDDAAFLGGMLSWSGEPEDHYVGPLRVARVEPLWAELDEVVAFAYDIATERLRDAGVEVTVVDIASARRATAAAWVITYSEAARIYGNLMDTAIEPLTPSMQRKIHGGRMFDDIDLRAAQRAGDELRVELSEVLAGVDAIMLPTTPGVARRDLESSHASDVAVFTRLASLAHLTSLSVPVGSRSGTLPAGMQLIGDNRRLARLITAASTVSDGQSFSVDDLPLGRSGDGGRGGRVHHEVGPLADSCGYEDLVRSAEAEVAHVRCDLHETTQIPTQ
ncbi:amidase [Rhodococcus sp. NPDC055024]